MPDEDKSFVERMAESTDPMAPLREEPSSAGNVPPVAGEGKGADGGAKSPDPVAAAAPNPEIAALKEAQSKLEERLFQSEQKNAYWAGQAARNAEGAKPPEEAPKPFQFNRDEFTAAMEKDPASAIYDLINKVQESGISLARKEIEGSVNGKLSEGQRRDQLQTAYRRDAEKTGKEFADFVGLDKDGKPVNPEFDREAFDAAQEIAKERGNPRAQDGNYLLSPGDLFAAASVVYGRWARNGKITAKPPTPTQEAPRRSLRQIIDEVPRSDNLGSGSRNGNKTGGVPKTIDDLIAVGHYTQREGQVAKNLIKMNEWNEANYVGNILRYTREGTFDSRN